MRRKEVISAAKYLGSLGGKSRAQRLTAEQRKASSQKAIEARWAGHVKIEHAKKV